MILYKEGRWWLPDGEQHLQEWMNKVNHTEIANGESRLTYQYHKYKVAMEYVRSRRHFVDVGAHVGLWSWVMARDSVTVTSFEPMPEHCQCWAENMKHCSNARLQPYALGAEQGRVRVKTRTPGSSGDTGVDPIAERSSLRATIQEDGHLAELRTLDSFDLQDVDFIKIDCEGYELYVLQGAVETILKWKPCLIVEQKPETGMADRYGLAAKDSIKFMDRLGARMRKVIQGDYIFSFD